MECDDGLYTVAGDVNVFWTTSSAMDFNDTVLGDADPVARDIAG